MDHQDEVEFYMNMKIDEHHIENFLFENVLDILFNSGNEFTLDMFNSLQPTESDNIDSLNPILIAELKVREKEAIDLAENDQLEQALEKLSDIISKHPTFASAYNNRAQVFRMKGELNKALDDVNYAIQHSNQDTKILRQAHTQKGVILKSMGKEVDAQREFAAGARYGNLIAKGIVKSNPYAKMCSAMVQTMLNPYQKED